MSKKLASIVDGALSLIPGGDVVANAFSSWQERRKSEAREILLTQIRQGDIDMINQDAFFSMLARFNRSVSEGVARNNLILLARLISGIGRVDKQDAKANTFNQYANMLESLTLEEIEYLAECIKGRMRSNPELCQSLAYKGFLLASPHTKINKSEIRKYAFDDSFAFPTTILSPVLEAQPIGFHDNESKSESEYKATTSMDYVLSNKLRELLRKYGNLWEDIAKDEK